MNILFVSRDRRDLWKHELFRDFVQQRIPDTVAKIICGEPNSKHFTPKENVDYIFDGYETFLKNNQGISTSDIVALHKVQSEIIPSSIYKSDNRFVHALTDERELALEQVYLVNQSLDLIESFNPTFIFMTGGGNLIRNVFFFAGQYHGAHCYRILNVSFLNPNREGVRYWFSANNYYRISGKHEDRFDYSITDVSDHVEDLIASIKNIDYKLDRYARTIARKKRTSMGRKALYRDFRSAVSLRTLSIRRKSRAWRRLISYKNYLLNRRLSTNPDDIPKPFFLFPLNVPEDAQIVMRAPQFRDLLSICEQVANVLPYGHVLAIKEHPGHLGMLDHYRLRAVLKHHPNIYYVSGDLRLWDLLKRTTALITVNSTSALEALINDIPVVTLGEAFYKGANLTYDVEYLFELQQILTTVLDDPLKEKRSELLKNVLSEFLQETVPSPGVVEQSGDKNYLTVIARGIVAKLEECS